MRFIPAVSPVQIQVPLPNKRRTAVRFYIKRPGGQAVKTPPFHGGNTGSSPVRVTTPFQPFLYGGIAQPVERPPHTRKVTDSSSVVSTILQRVRTKRFGLALFYASAGRASNSAAAGSPSPPHTQLSPSARLFYRRILFLILLSKYVSMEPSPARLPAAAQFCPESTGAGV